MAKILEQGYKFKKGGEEFLRLQVFLLKQPR